MDDTKEISLPADLLKSHLEGYVNGDIDRNEI